MAKTPMKTQTGDGDPVSKTHPVVVMWIMVTFKRVNLFQTHRWIMVKSNTFENGDVKKRFDNIVLRRFSVDR